MEDMIKALLDVVRAQHSAAEGTDEAPFNMDDIVDMAMNILGRPDEAEEETEMVDSIQKMVEDLAPDIFPPKTFEEQSDDEKVATAANMIQDRLMNSLRGEQSSRPAPEPYVPSYTMEEEEEAEETNPADLNDLIYKNLMDMMGLQNPQVEYPFDRSQIQYGSQKTFTQQLQEEEEERRRVEREEQEKRSKLSAWELAQNVIDEDEEKHQKEPYIPQVEEAPKGKSASQLAAEAIKASEERAKAQTEIERQAEQMMARAREKGIDPMKFALHQQEILDYMEKNSDELVSFEDYEDLSPQEKYEIERQIQIEKEIESGIDPSEVKGIVPKEFLPEGYQVKEDGNVAAQAASQTAEAAQPMFTEEMLRQLSQEVLRENSAMILAENENENMEDLNAAIMENLMKMMNTGGIQPMAAENVDDLLEQVVREQTGEPEQTREIQIEAAPAQPVAVNPEAKVDPEPVEPDKEETPVRAMSAVELAMAAQKARQPVQKEETEGKSAVELAKEALARELEKSRAKDSEEEEDLEELLGKTDSEDLFADLDDFEEEAEDEEKEVRSKRDEGETEETKEKEEVSMEADQSSDHRSSQSDGADDDSDEYIYVDPEEYVLGEHTQAEVDEALENLNTLGLEGEVFERAKRMLLLELAGSEAELEAWLKEQENNKKKKAAKSALEEEDLATSLDDIDEDELAAEFDSLDEDFEEEAEASVLEEEPEEAEESEEEIIEEETLLEEVTEEISEEDQPEERGIIAEEQVEEETISSYEDTAAKSPKAEKTNKDSRSNKTKRNVVKKKEKATKSQAPQEEQTPGESKSYQVSVKSSFVLKNSASYMDKFTDYIVETQENRKLSTGFKKLDGMLRFGLHKGSYFIDAAPMYLKNAFMQQIADRAAESGVDVLYISTELSRYELMTDTISRLSYEMNGKNSEKAVSVMDIMTGQEGASVESLHDELNWYRGRISEHLYILDQEAVDEVIDSMEDAAPGDILAEIIRSIVREGAHKPVVFIDNIENIAFAETAEEMEPMMQGIKALAKELSIPIVMSYGYAPAESMDDDVFVDRAFQRAIGNMCDVYMELQYAPMITEDGLELTVEDIEEMREDGDSLLIDILLHRNRRNMRASCQIMGTPKYNFFEE